MPARLQIAYTLIALMIVAATALIVVVRRKSKARRDQYK